MSFLLESIFRVYEVTLSIHDKVSNTGAVCLDTILLVAKVRRVSYIAWRAIFFTFMLDCRVHVYLIAIAYDVTAKARKCSVRRFPSVLFSASASSLDSLLSLSPLLIANSLG